MLTPEQRIAIKRLWETGAYTAQRELAALFGVDVATISRTLQGSGGVNMTAAGLAEDWMAAAVAQRQPRQGKEPASPAERAAIGMMWESGLFRSKREIARVVGMSPAQVNRIIKAEAERKAADVAEVVEVEPPRRWQGQDDDGDGEYRLRADIRQARRKILRGENPGPPPPKALPPSKPETPPRPADLELLDADNDADMQSLQDAGQRPTPAWRRKLGPELRPVDLVAQMSINDGEAWLDRVWDDLTEEEIADINRFVARQMTDMRLAKQRSLREAGMLAPGEELPDDYFYA